MMYTKAYDEILSAPGLKANQSFLESRKAEIEAELVSINDALRYICYKVRSTEVPEVVYNESSSTIFKLCKSKL